jgi:hypothetical protein
MAVFERGQAVAAVLSRIGQREAPVLRRTTSLRCAALRCVLRRARGTGCGFFARRHTKIARPASSCPGRGAADRTLGGLPLRRAGALPQRQPHMPSAFSWQPPARGPGSASHHSTALRSVACCAAPGARVGRMPQSFSYVPRTRCGGPLLQWSDAAQSRGLAPTPTPDSPPLPRNERERRREAPVLRRTTALRCAPLKCCAAPGARGAVRRCPNVARALSEIFTKTAED